MVPRELIGTARVPGGEDLRLFRRGADFMIVLDRNELMNSRMSGSEEALATMTIERLQGRAAPRLLIGGYGMGFTLRAALAALPGDARVTVSVWARNLFNEQHVFYRALSLTSGYNGFFNEARTFGGQVQVKF